MSVGEPGTRMARRWTAVAGLVVAALGVMLAAAEAPRVVFLISEDPDNYGAHETIPPFAEWLEDAHGFAVTVILGEGEPVAFRFPELEEALADADAAVVFFRRRALSEEQLGALQAYVEAGNPLVGIRTANHAFAIRPNVEGEIAEGYADWWDFPPDVLGCENRGYGPVDPGTAVEPAPDMTDHPILDGVEPLAWRSEGNVYHVAPLVDEEAELLLTGTVEEAVEPIAWTRRTEHGGPVFYTSLGHPTDFETPQFRALLVNGVRWAIEQR